MVAANRRAWLPASSLGTLRSWQAQLAELAAAPALHHAACQLAPLVDPTRSSAFDCILY